MTMAVFFPSLDNFSVPRYRGSFFRKKVVY